MPKKAAPKHMHRMPGSGHMMKDSEMTGMMTYDEKGKRVKPKKK